MIDKKRRDITLGEMQDECKTRKVCETANEKCSYYGVCAFFHRIAPSKINLTDPPRFNEAQMALLKGLYANGVMKLRSDCAITSLFSEDHEYIGNLINSQIGIELSDGETLDLAELLGKDGK